MFAYPALNRNKNKNKPKQNKTKQKKPAFQNVRSTVKAMARGKNVLHN